MVRHKRQRVNQKTMDKAKALLNAGVPKITTAKLCDMAEGTLWRIEKAEFDVKTYRNMFYSKRQRPQVKLEANVASKEDRNSILSELQTINKNLEALVDAWNNAGKRKFF